WSGALTRTCSTRGRLLRASSPQALWSVGTTRQPATSSPSAASSSCRTMRACPASAGSGLRKTQPTAQSRPRRMSCSAATARRKSSGFFIRSPQPSPVLPSAATAPRWVRRSSAWIAVCTSQWLGLPSMWAIRPKPQLSFSKSGRYRPVLSWMVLATGLASAVWVQGAAPRRRQQRGPRFRHRARHPAALKKKGETYYLCARGGANKKSCAARSGQAKRIEEALVLGDGKAVGHAGDVVGHRPGAAGRALLGFERRQPRLLLGRQQ